MMDVIRIVFTVSCCYTSMCAHATMRAAGEPSLVPVSCPRFDPLWALSANRTKKERGRA